MTLTPFSERLAVELSLPVFTTNVCRVWDSNTQSAACRANDLTHSATAHLRGGKHPPCALNIHISFFDSKPLYFENLYPNLENLGNNSEDFIEVVFFRNIISSYNMNIYSLYLQDI